MKFKDDLVLNSTRIFSWKIKDHNQKLLVNHN